jgi:hypothetical protein
MGVQTVSAASRKYALPLLFSVASSSGHITKPSQNLTVDR